MNSPRERREPNLGGGSKKETHSPRDSLGDHEISHGEISHGHQENLLVNKFPFFTPFIDGVLQRGHFQHFKHTVDRWPTN